MDQRVGGIIEVKVNGELYLAKGDFTYNLGRNKKETVTGTDRVHGYKEVPQPCFIEGKITDQRTLALDVLVTLVNATVTVTLANGKVIVLRDAWYASEGTCDSGEGEIPFKFEGKSAEEIR